MIIIGDFRRAASALCGEMICALIVENTTTTFALFSLKIHYLCAANQPVRKSGRSNRANQQRPVYIHSAGVTRTIEVQNRQNWRPHARLNDYNSMTGKSKENIYQYLFACRVADMAQVEKDVKAEFSKFREQKSREIYFYNEQLFADYSDFIKAHPSFIEEIAGKRIQTGGR